MSGQYFSGVMEEEEGDDRFRDRECYMFNTNLDPQEDDGRCIHCRHYLTLQCKHIGDFVDEDGEA